MRRVTPFLIFAFAACADGALAPSESASFARIHDAEGSHGGTPFMVVLVPDEEPPLPGNPNVPGGDPNSDAGGVMVLTLNSGQQEICFKTSFSGLSSTVSNAHIHIGPSRQAGPVVVPLATPAWPVATEGTVAQCVFAPREVIKAIRKNPGAYYVNVHTRNTGSVPEVGRPAGAIRGQMFKTQGSNVNHF